MTYRMAPMSAPILVLTLGLLALPAVFALLAMRGTSLLAVPAMLMVVLYAWVWLWFRPTEFRVRPDAIEVIWPLRRREILRREISAVRLIDRATLRREVGWGMRVGAGGLWGGFGWLWTTRRGLVRMYVSRVDHFVWIERGPAQPWLITPDQPEAFVRALSAHG